MHSITAQHGTPLNFMSQLADATKILIDKNFLSLDNDIIKGHFTSLHCSNDVQCLVSHYKLKQDFHLHKRAAADTRYILRIDEIRNSVDSFIEIEGKYTSLVNKAHTTTLLNSKQEFTFICSKNSLIGSIEIHIPIKLLEKKINKKEALGLFYTYINSNGMNLHFDFNDADVKLYFNEIMRNVSDTIKDLVSAEKYINRLLEKYISNLSEKLTQILNEQKTKIVKDEISRLITVKDYLIKDLSASPPAFSTLLSVAAMSSTSLKTKFKKMYGANLFEFFQKKRMQKARVLLLTRRYSIKEIGRQVGYVNLSNFSIAFKKEFGELPSHMAKTYKKLSFAATNNDSFNEVVNH